LFYSNKLYLKAPSAPVIAIPVILGRSGHVCPNVLNVRMAKVIAGFSLKLRAVVGYMAVLLERGLVSVVVGSCPLVKVLTPSAHGAVADFGSGDCHSVDV
jgi:hypothetical protein